MNIGELLGLLDILVFMEMMDGGVDVFWGVNYVLVVGGILEEIGCYFVCMYFF